MVVTIPEPSEDELSTLWQCACVDYARETGIPLMDDRFPKVQESQDLSRQLELEQDNFEKFRMKQRPLLHAMQTVVAPFENWGNLIPVAAAAFPPASLIMGAMLLLVKAANKVTDAFNVLVDLFERLGSFALRLESYKGIPLSEGMKTVIVNALVTFLAVCAASQKVLSQGSLKARLSKWAKNILVEDTSISSLLDKLEKLTSEEHMMVSAHGLKLAQQALRNTEKLLDRDNHKSDHERLKRIKAALSPVSASGQVLSSITQNRIPGSGGWVEDRLRSWWQGSQPLLWLHGGPGVGKTHLAGKIITDLASAEPSAPQVPAVASFFFKNNDVDLRSLNKALRTLAWQVATQQPSFAAHAEEFCIKDDPENSHIVWEKLFMNYFTNSPMDITTCFVIDGIDEANTKEQEIFFSLLEKTFAAEDNVHRIFPLRVVFFSRDSVRGMLDEHMLSWIPEIQIGNAQNKDDLHQYVSLKLQRAKLFRGLPAFQAEVAKDIIQGAEGMWEWANLVIKSVLRCRTKEQIRKVIKTVPRGISAMLQEELRRLSRELSGLEHSSEDGQSDGEEGATRIEQLNLLLSLVTFAEKPLTQSMLEEGLELILKEEVLNLEDDIRTVYSSLFSIGPSDGIREVVTLRHSSFYEFFKSVEKSEFIRFTAEQTEASFLYICLYALIHIFTPCSKRSTRLNWYAEKFLPSHLSRANLRKAEKLHGEISALFVSLFSEVRCTRCFCMNCGKRSPGSYLYYPATELKTLGEYWLNAQDADTANKRAETVLDWLLPEAKQMFLDHAQASAVASDACPFTILFSFMVCFWSQRWLEPEEIKFDDGFSEVAPAFLTVYNAMAAKGNKKSVSDSRISGVVHAMSYGGDPLKVILPAESQQLQRTPMWHARVAQALLSQCDAQALVHFRTSLDEDQKAPTFTTETVSTIHRDMGRAYSELGRHKEALEHLEQSDSLRPRSNQKFVRGPNDRIAHFLNKARMQCLAGLTDEAIATAEEAWRLFPGLCDQRLHEYNEGIYFFFSIFVEVNHTHRLRSVFEATLKKTEDAAIEKAALDDPRNSYSLEFYSIPTNFRPSFWQSFYFQPRVMYRALHYALSREDQQYLDFLARTLEIISDNAFFAYSDLTYYLARTLYEKGRKDIGAQGWYIAASKSGVYACRRSKCDLAAFCLYDGDNLSCGSLPLLLDTETDISDACLVIASWFKDCGNIAIATDALRWCVRECIALLSSEDRDSSHENAFMHLFRAFLIMTDHDEDLEVALYCVKYHDEQQWMTYLSRSGLTEIYDDDGALDLYETLRNSHLKDRKDQSQGNGNAALDDYIDTLVSLVGSNHTGLWNNCFGCKQEFRLVHQWYFCRSCPLSLLCRRCYHQFEADGSSSSSGTSCNIGHKFHYSGSFLRPQERVPGGMIPLFSAPGSKKRNNSIEEWMNRLAAKWKTSELAVDGGLSAWCMRVLPEPQRTRWATVFTTKVDDRIKTSNDNDNDHEQ